MRPHVIDTYQSSMSLMKSEEVMSLLQLFRGGGCCLRGDIERGKPVGEGDQGSRWQMAMEGTPCDDVSKEE